MMKRTLYTLQETHALAQKFAKHLPLNSVIALEGDLGTGKTTFVKALFEAFGYSGLVNSPTFTLYQVYDFEPPFVHVDAYRLDNDELPGDLDDIFQYPGLICIEWADRIQRALPDDYIRMVFTWVGPEEREIEVTGYGRYHTLIAQLMA
jgi:tRNA threonylcarbamoyladenosine biosynthesis protein TsaE